ncbi:glycerophosphodiester phosphodiesterase family protein, partial [Staphylococcus aureus]|uniref:glycerophosphodiester phosphodiesterase family protein n=1 Tax=Staphylococcus aureus TaxID=1280 RepID=UPI0037D9A0A0
RNEGLSSMGDGGGSGYAGEDRFEGYDKSDNELKGCYMEIDLEGTKDGDLVGMDDESVKGRRNGEGKVEDYSVDELKQLDGGSWFNKKYG